jgi:hypothetical protein
LDGSRQSHIMIVPQSEHLCKYPLKQSASERR